MADEPQRQEPHARSSTAEVFGRVRVVEGEIAQVREQLAGISANLTTLQSTLANVSTRLEMRSSTDWKALASWGAVILTLVAMASTLALTPIRERVSSHEQMLQQVAVERLSDTRQAIAEAEQRGRVIERVDTLKREVDGLRARP